MEFLKRHSYLLLLLILVSCNGEILEKLDNDRAPGGFCPNVRLANGFCPDDQQNLLWDFTTASNYTFNSNYVEVSSGAASLKIVDQTHSGTDFNSGTHVGTYLSSSKITLLSAPAITTTHVNTALPAKAVNLVGYWRMDGDWTDDSTIGSDGIAQNSPTISTSSRLGTGAGTFAGTNQRIEIGSITELMPSKVTMAGWVNIADNSLALQFIGGYGNTGSVGYWLGHSLANGFHFRGCDGVTGGSACAINSDIVAEEGSWYHIVGTFEAGSTKIYVNGELKGTKTTVVGGLSYTGLVSGFVLGSTEGFSAVRHLNGKLDEVGLWNDVLTDVEILALYQSQNANFTELSSSWTPRWDSVVGYWKMDGNWQDSSGNGNHGTPSGNTTFGTNSKVGSQTAVLDGVGDDVRTSAFDLGATENVTMSAWVKNTNSLPALNEGIIWKTSTKFEIYVQTDGRLRSYIENAVAWHTPVVSPVYTDWNSWHYIVVVYNGADVKIYRDGVEVAVSGAESGAIPAGNTGLNIGSSSSSGVKFNGLMDDVVIWNASLNASEIKAIYNRQKQKYAGHYESPVIDLGTSGTWTNLDTVTSLPFGKEIVAQTSESSSDYSSLTSSFNTNLEAYWNFNEDLWDTTSNQILDLSGNNRHGTSVGTVNTVLGSLFNRSGNFNGDTGRVDVGEAVPSDLFFNSQTISMWIKLDSPFVSTLVRLIDANFYGIYFDHAGVSGEDDSLQCVLHDGTAFRTASADTTGLSAGGWHHIVCFWDNISGKVGMYINGVKQTSFDNSSYDGTIGTAADQLAIGASRVGGINSFNGEIDEVAIWSRNLTATEIQQLYRRGANRVKYQVKSCVDSSCNCKSFNVAPVGSATDCDGDGTLNTVDTSDTYLAEFIGPGGNGATSYSELFNRAPADITTTCTLNTSDSDNSICMDDEITLAGDSNATSPNFTFSNMAASAVPTNNRYFQYKVLMEAEENTACSGSPCMPELTSIEVGPTGRYYAGSPVIAPTTPIVYNNINQLSFSEGGSCSLTYQLSPDGATYYYYNGSAWVVAASESVALSSSAAVSSANIGSFVTTVGAGSLYFKAFMTSDTTQSCSLDKIQLINLN